MRRLLIARVLGSLIVVLAGVLTLGAARLEAAPGDEVTGDQVVGELPGTVTLPAELAARLEATLAAKGAEYKPRTEHFNEDGSPKYTNRLILESSPYLLQHAHNPVNWYPWGDEAFEAARQLGRPVFLSIGYSTCHWCHVMERESFEDEEIARFLNDNYVAIKVDREERPDVDSIYMAAVQLLTGRGGWPMSVWLTPDRQPFYGGTYFPARDGDRGARYGFLTLLVGLERAWEAERDELVGRADQLTALVAQNLAGSPQAVEGLPAPSLVDAAAASYRDSFDSVNGGLEGPPKFPSNLSIRLLLRAHERGDDESAYLDMAALTLEKMAAGGMFDQVGGGFHRYSTDAEWLVPHFEKMLYDNALLTIAYLEGYQATGRPELAQTARQILDYVAKEMTGAQGGFFSATDADSPTPGGLGAEGWFFTWTPGELEEVLGTTAAGAVATFYGVTAEGNFEGRSILHRPRPLSDVAAQLEMSPLDLERLLEEARGTLYEARAQRPPPLLDDKVLTAWNGLMISAFAVGGQILGEVSYVETAERAARFVLERMRSEGRLLRTWRDGAAKQAAFLDDYAFFIAGLIDLFQATGEPRWLREALSLQEVLDDEFWDDAVGGYFLTGAAAVGLLAREKPTYDGAEPSGNSVALLNLLRLAELTTDDRYRERGDRLLKSFAPVLAASPTALSEMLVGLDFRHGTPKEIVLVTPGAVEQTKPFLDLLHRRFIPNKVVVATSAGPDHERLTELVPFVEGKVPRDGLPTAYVCESFVCKLPTTDLEVFARQLED